MWLTGMDVIEILYVMLKWTGVNLIKKNNEFIF
jgi:hypothetical protein